MGLDNIYSILIFVIFLIGYALITLEHFTLMNKAAIALMMAILCWVVQFADPHFSRLDQAFFRIFSQQCSDCFFSFRCFGHCGDH
jgi:hypothetical protein